VETPICRHITMEKMDDSPRDGLVPSFASSKLRDPTVSALSLPTIRRWFELIFIAMWFDDLPIESCDFHG